jgi:hypothetical protein
MKKFTIFPLVYLLSGVLLTSCGRSSVVHAGGEGDYKPRPAPLTQEDAERGISGELLRVNLAGKTIAVRIDNGMVQTFKVDSDTTVTGIEDDKNKGCSCSRSPVRILAGKEGSEVIVKWRDESGGVKAATSVEVAQTTALKSTRRPRKPPY